MVCFIYVSDQSLAEQLDREKGLFVLTVDEVTTTKVTRNVSVVTFSLQETEVFLFFFIFAF